jgi:hypothetical protein
MDRPQTVFGILRKQDETSQPLAPNIGQAAPKIKPIRLWGRMFFLWLLSPFGESQWMPTKKTL